MQKNISRSKKKKITTLPWNQVSNQSQIKSKYIWENPIHTLFIPKKQRCGILEWVASWFAKLVSAFASLACKFSEIEIEIEAKTELDKSDIIQNSESWKNSIGTQKKAHF